MTETKEEKAARLEAEANFLLRESGFNVGGQPIAGSLAKERRRGKAISLGLSPYHFDDYQDNPRDE
jgi:hypothetical protein